MDLMNMLVILATIAMVIFLVVGLIKKTAWMCIVAVAIAVLLGITQPAQLIEIKDTIVSTVDQIIDPFRDDDYHGMTGEDKETIPPNKGFGEIGMDE